MKAEHAPVRFDLRFALLAILAIFSVALPPMYAQGTAFTYQGHLSDGGGPATGTYDLQTKIFDAVTAGSPVGPTLTNAAVAVSNGMFTVALDFGAGVFTGENLWLELAVRTNGAATFTTLSPRQALTATPYAVTASNLTGTLPTAQLSGTIPATNLAGTVPLAQLPGAVLTNNAGGVALSGDFAGAFSGDGGTLTNVNASQLGGQPAGAFAPASGSANYVSKTGDTMTGQLGLPGLAVNNPTGTAYINVSGGGDSGYGYLGLSRATTNGSSDVAFLTGGSADFALGTAQGIAGLSDFSIYDYGASLNALTILKTNGFVGIGTVSPQTALQVNGTTTSTAFAGDGSGLTGLNYNNIANPPSIPSTNNLVALNDARALAFNNAANAISGVFTGSGAALTFLNPANISSGTAGINISGNAASATLAASATSYSGAVSDSQLSGNIPRLNAANIYTQPNTFSGSITATNPNNAFAIQNVTADPASPATGQIWLRTDITP